MISALCSSLHWTATFEEKDTPRRGRALSPLRMTLEYDTDVEHRVKSSHASQPRLFNPASVTRGSRPPSPFKIVMLDFALCFPRRWGSEKYQQESSW